VGHALTDERQCERGLGLPEPDQVALGARPRREALRPDVQRLEQVRLPRPVLTDDEDDAR